MDFPAARLDELIRHARALPPRAVAAGFLAVALAGGLLLTRQPPRPVTPRPPVHRVPPHRHLAALRKPLPLKPVPRPKTPAPPKPGAFAQEQAMSYRQLMARWTPLVQEAARRFKISGLWIRAVMEIESGGRTMLAPGRKIVSPAGAMGLMQLMPKTWTQMRAAERLGSDPFDPHDNVIAGAAYLRDLYHQYGYPTMFAAYNDGPGMLAAHAALDQPIPAETENYVRDIASILGTGVRYHAGGKHALAALTRPDGSAVMIDAGTVVAVRAALPGEYAPGVQTVIAVGRLRQGVRESVAKATGIIRAHGGLI